MRYVLYFQPRSGSTLVCSRLNSGTRRLVNGYEIVDADAAWRADLLHADERSRFDAAVKKTVVDRFFELHANTEVAGFKVAPYQVDDDLPGFFQHVSKLVRRQIFMTRDNPIQSALSQLWSIARARQGMPARILKGEGDTVRPARIDRDEFEYFVMDSILERENVLALSRLVDTPLVISYEALCADQKSVFESIRKYLELPSDIKLAKSDLVKVRTDGAASHVENLGEVELWVREMGFDPTLLHQELAQIDSDDRRPPAQGLRTCRPPEQTRRNSARAFLAGRIVQLRRELIERGKERESRAIEAERVIADFSARAAKAEDYSVHLQEELATLRAVHEADQRNWNAHAQQSQLHARELERRATRSEAYAKSEIERLGKLLKAAERRAKGHDEQAARALAAMADRAARAEQFHDALESEVARLQKANGDLVSAHARDQKQHETNVAHAAKVIAEMGQRAERAEQYNGALQSEVERLQEAQARSTVALAQAIAAQEQSVLAASESLSAMTARAERAEQFNAALKLELIKAQQALERLQEVHQRDAEIRGEQTAKALEAMTRRAERSEQYANSLREELDRCQASNAQLVGSTKDNADSGLASARKALEEMSKRAERAENYNDALKGELAQALLAHEEERLAWESSKQQASAYASSLQLRAEHAEQYNSELERQLAKFRPGQAT